LVLRNIHQNTNSRQPFAIDVKTWGEEGWGLGVAGNYFWEHSSRLSEFDLEKARTSFNWNNRPEKKWNWSMVV